MSKGRGFENVRSAENGRPRAFGGFKRFKGKKQRERKYRRALETRFDVEARFFFRSLNAYIGHGPDCFGLESTDTTVTHTGHRSTSYRSVISINPNYPIR